MRTNVEMRFPCPWHGGVEFHMAPCGEERMQDTSSFVSDTVIIVLSIFLPTG